MWSVVENPAIGGVFKFRLVFVVIGLVARDPDYKVPMALGVHQVPGVWRHMLPEDVSHRRFPGECQSTCSACPKVKEENFHPDVRCCSYHPRVPNFLLGLALEDPETAPLIHQMIADGLATPEGLQATPVQLRQSLEQSLAGPAHGGVGVVCRFLDTKLRRCGIYKYRDSVCATFFCKHDHQDEGYEFWRSLQAVAGQCEASLSQWLMAAIGFDVDGYMSRFDALSELMPTLVAHDAEGWPTTVLKGLWGEWWGREADFYRACAAKARACHLSLAAELEAWVIRSPQAYDAAFLNSLPDALRDQMRRDGVLSGQPVPISDLWYQFNLAHRNLWQPRD